MAKNLILIRHAATQSSQREQKDFDRPLTRQGIQDASKVGRFIYEKDFSADSLISSPAHRAIHTAQLIAEQIKFDVSLIMQEQELYEASVRSILALINSLPDDNHQVIIVGHNPAITYMAEYLCKRDLGSLAPGALAWLLFDQDTWKEVSENSGTLHKLSSPNQEL